MPVFSIFLGRDGSKPCRERLGILLLAVACFLIWSATSWARWAGFAYRTFDLAYYVQALWQLIHGRWQVSVENVPLLGNHVEPIVFLIAPFFFFFRHPMLFVLLQNAALASMGPVAYGIGKRLGFDSARAFLLAAAILLTPATGYVALHEFHPEALAAPFFLLMLRAWFAGARGKHWLWFAAALACKENIALLLVAYCVVQALVERRRGFAEVRAWFLWPMLLAGGWFVLCVTVITPRFNSGNIDYAALYDRLGNSGGEILTNAFVRPELFFRALVHALRHGNLLWALLVPSLGLPLLRARWLLICAPILLQHLLSWRASEWTIYFHYAAPLLPFFWLAAAEALAPRERWPRFAPAARNVVTGLIVPACLAAQFIFGPAAGIVATTHDWSAGKTERVRRNSFLAKIPAAASVVAPMPYLSHLAMREQLYSLHYILKGLKTLSRAPFEPPPPTDFVLIDYGDTATFDPVAGYYHPAMRTIDGQIIPSSDQLLHDFLARTSWRGEAVNELTLLCRGEVAPLGVTNSGESIAALGPQTHLLEIEKSREMLSPNERLKVTTRWRFEALRAVFPWLELRVIRADAPPVIITRGLCAIEAGPGLNEETWEVDATTQLPHGNYAVEAIFTDHAKMLWAEKGDRMLRASSFLAPPISLGTLRVRLPNEQ